MSSGTQNLIAMITEAEEELKLKYAAR